MYESQDVNQGEPGTGGAEREEEDPGALELQVVGQLLEEQGGAVRLGGWEA